jgi:hypothetical protein
MDIDWKLLDGSHDFPGPDGGTCINEAAIVAAGLEYRGVTSIWDCPPCFSRPISAYALVLNDRMPDDTRQELLMPFVTRLSGTADAPEVEIRRAAYIAAQTVERIIPIAMRCAGQEGSVAAAKAAARAAARAAKAAVKAAAGAAAWAAADAADAAADAADAAWADAAWDAGEAAAKAANRRVYEVAVSILDEAIRLGNQTELDVALVTERMEKAKQQAAAR